MQTWPTTSGASTMASCGNFLDRRIKDGVIRRMIDKWLKAGVLEDGQIHYPDEGTPQGGVISPLLSNIYLHYVLDEWFIEAIQPRLKGKSGLIRLPTTSCCCLTTSKTPSE
jgi:RNA-directed DNA polymerase